jgi:hypothetical protein
MKDQAGRQKKWGLAGWVALVALATAWVDVAGATTMKRCGDRYFGCTDRCRARAEAKYGTDWKNDPSHPAVIEMNNCDKRTCLPQLKACTANASDTPKPTSAVDDPGSMTDPTDPALGQTNPGFPTLADPGQTGPSFGSRTGIAAPVGPATLY